MSAAVPSRGADGAPSGGLGGVRRSIRATLVAWLAGGLAVSLAAAAVLTYLRARDEANALFDLQLRQTAASVLGMPIAGGATFPGTAGDEGLVVQIWDRNGVRVLLSRPPATDAERVPARSTPGFATIDTPSGPYRVFSVLAGGQLVQVGQPLAVRTELATRLATSTVLPLAIIAPLAALLVWIAVRRGLAPLTRVADAVQKRSPNQLAPLAAQGWPREIAPLVEALNGLLGRLEHAIDAQRAFVADAAHELRTPLAALALQAQLAQRAESREAREEALAALRGGLARTTRIVEQLLALAREEPGVSQRPLEPLAPAELARDVVAGLAPLATAKSLDLGIERADDTARIEGDAASIKTLWANLIDNAIRYTPPGGRIDVAVERVGADVELRVRDTGPGIPAADRERAFERFARGDDTQAPGSGLGLAIVKRIAERHSGNVELREGDDGNGLAVSVRLPALSLS